MPTISDVVQPTELPRVTFDWTPKGGPLTINVGGNTYPWAANEPQAGAPDQPDEFYTTTNQLLTFTATVLLHADDFILEYLWDFGDGVFGYGQTIQHMYTSYSPQTRVSLCVTDNHRRRVCVAQQINLIPAERVNLQE